MFKKNLIISTILVSTFSSAFAGSFYIGPTFIVRDVVAPSATSRETSPRFSAGYADNDADFYLGGEIFAMPFSITLSDEHSTSATGSAKTSYGYGASIIPGMMFSDHTIGYFRFGPIWTRFSNKSITRIGAQAGVGMQTSLSENWDIRGEYLYTVYGSVSGIGSPKADQFGVGFVYKFI